MPTQENALGRYTILRRARPRPARRHLGGARRETGAVVALKTLDPALRKSGASFAAGSFEGCALASLKHRNIVEVLDAGEMGGAPYVAMEMLEGESLRTIPGTAKRPASRAIDIIHQAAGGLAYAHYSKASSRGHPAFEPHRLCAPGWWSYSFGIAHLQQATAPDYQSPEQLRSQPVGHRSDIFSLGAVFYDAHAPASLRRQAQ